MKNYNDKLAYHAEIQTGEKPVVAEFNQDKTWLLGFKNKLAAYSLYIEYYKCQSGIRVFRSENLNCYCVTSSS